MDANMLAALIIIVALLLIAAALLMRRKRSETLQRRFGPEYSHTVESMGSRGKAEAELEARRKRVEKLHIVPLSPADAERFSQAWRSLQGRFVDNPHGVMREADQLVCELMMRRGYPMSDFEHRAADISVDHPEIVKHYRAAHDIALRDRDGSADTESVRQAVVHYRALFAELLEVGEPAPVVERERPRRSRLDLGLGRQPDRAMARDETKRDPRRPERPL